MNNMLLVFHAMLCQAVRTAPTSATALATPRQLALAIDKQPTASSLKYSYLVLAIKGYEKKGRRLVQRRERRAKKREGEAAKLWGLPKTQEKKENGSYCFGSWIWQRERGSHLS